MDRMDRRRPGRLKRIATRVPLVASLLLAAPVLQPTGPAGGDPGPADIAARGLTGDAGAAPGPDDAGAREAFLQAYAVFTHPRCMNCHPAGDVPLQGDDSRPHAQNVKRGPYGRGRYALKCANCHQHTNLPGENMPPGNPTWHLPPPAMRMVFQGKTPGELARQLKDPRQNGGKTLEQILHHVAEDPLVLWGWDPGDGRALPPLSHAEFVRRMREWIEKGAASPE